MKQEDDHKVQETMRCIGCLVVGSFAAGKMKMYSPRGFDEESMKGKLERVFL
jgi:hypothetical protein